MRPNRFAIYLAAALAFATAAGAEGTLDDAILSGDLNAVEAALTEGPDLNRADPRLMLTPLTLAAIRGEAGIVARLIEAGADPDAENLGGQNSLSVAVRSCGAGPDIVAALVAAGAAIENRAPDGLTPVMAAVQAGRTDIALALLAAGADVNARGRSGDGVLNYAIYGRNPVVVQAAMDKGVATEQLRVLYTTRDYFPGDARDLRWNRADRCGQPS